MKVTETGRITSNRWEKYGKSRLYLEYKGEGWGRKALATAYIDLLSPEKLLYDGSGSSLNQDMKKESWEAFLAYRDEMKTEKTEKKTTSYCYDCGHILGDGHYCSECNSYN